MRLIPHAAAMTEFVTDPTDGVRYTGTCGEDAGLALAHVVDPVKWPLNAATLAAIARWEIGQHQASANGSEPLSSIASWLAAEGIAHTSYGYGEPYAVDWRGIFNQWGGIKPLLVEYAHTSAGLVGDEAGVSYHFNTLLGWDPDALVGLFADGDNIIERSGGTGLARYTLLELEAAGVCGLIVGEYELGAVIMSGVPAGWKDDGSTLTAPNGAQVGHAHGFRDLVLRGWAADNWPEGAEQSVAEVELANTTRGAGVTQFFRYSQLAWTQATGAYVVYVGAEALHARGQITALDGQLSAAQANLQAAQSQRDALSAQLAAAQQELASANAKIQTVIAQRDAESAQVTQLQQQLTSATQPPTPQEQALDLLGRALKAYLATN